MGAPPNSQVAPLPSALPFRLVSKTIGAGAYASIRKAIPLNAPAPVIAIKFINKEHAFRTGRLTAKQLSMEIALHKHLGKHDNIIQFIQTGEDPQWHWIAMELADGGDLFDKIEADEGVGEDIAHFYFSQLVSAIEYMHSKGVAHRDIKPENILLDGEGNLKVADFGLAALFMHKGLARTCNTVCGSPPYIAPEIVNGRRSNRQDLLDEGYQANICDIWSAGVVLFVLLVGNTPWDEPTMHSEEFKEYVDTKGNTTDELWQQLPPSMISLLHGLLNLDPKSRFTLSDIRAHPWVRRKNRYMSSSGKLQNPVMLATDMLGSLHIDMTQQRLLDSQTSSYPSQDADAMDIDSSAPRRSRSRTNPPNPLLAKANALSTDEPETPIAESQFDWERPPRPASSSQQQYDSTPMSQSPASHYQNPPTSTPLLSQMPPGAQDALSQDPVMSQFSSTPGVQVQTLTQIARGFRDVLPSYSLCRFLSPQPLSAIVSLLLPALRDLGVQNVEALAPSQQQLDAWDADGQACIRVKVVDGRSQWLTGHVVVDREYYSQNGTYMSDVQFRKLSGDPLEWRRFFKNVVLAVANVVLRPG